MFTPSVNRRGLSLKSRLLTAVLASCLLLPLAALRISRSKRVWEILGNYHDVSGAAVPNATVIMTGKKTNIVEMTTSDAAGSFGFKTLPAGEYEMKALKRGFDEYRAPQVVLEPDREASMNVTLKVAAVSDEVDVVAQGTSKSSRASGKPARLRVGGDVEAAKRTNLGHPDLSRVSEGGRHPRYRDPPCSHRYGWYSAVTTSHEQRDRPGTRTCRCRSRQQMALPPNSPKWPAHRSRHHNHGKFQTIIVADRPRPGDPRRMISAVSILEEGGWKQQRSARALAVDFCAAMPGRASRWPAPYWEEHRWSQPKARCAPRIGRSWASRRSR